VGITHTYGIQNISKKLFFVLLCTVKKNYLIYHYNNMEKYLDFIREFHDNNPIEIEFVNNHLKKHLVNNPENKDEIEQILDFLYSKKIDISKV